MKEDGGAIELLTRVYREKGLGGWYKGLGAQIVKAVLCQGMSPSRSPLFHPFLGFFSFTYRSLSPYRSISSSLSSVLVGKQC